LETNGDSLETKQLTYLEASEQLRKAYEQEKIQLTAHISTLEVMVSNLQNSLVKAQNIISDNVQTILRLQECTNQKWLQEQEA
jgi:hypothetical protein